MRRFGFDAAILFSDILVPLAPMGAPFNFGNGSPRLEKPLQDEKSIQALHTVDSRDQLAYVGQAIRLITSELGDTPLIGFAGAPFTLAAYLVEGGGSQNYLNLKTMLYKRPDLLTHLLEKLADQVADYLCMQIDAVVKAVQLFDT